MNLKNVQINRNVVITSLSGNCDKLRDLGFCENLNVCKLADGRNIICRLCGATIAINKHLAEDIIVSEDNLD